MKLCACFPLQDFQAVIRQYVRNAVVIEQMEGEGGAKKPTLLNGTIGLNGVSLVSFR